MLEVIKDRQGFSPTIVVTQVPLENWFELIGDPTVAGAIPGWLIRNTHKIQERKHKKTV
ncbi:MAG: ATP-binding protein [Deltaproteobacteria bacterium]|nr:ATP-binding protein [Deltaproteobacteria bacterium]